MLDNEQIVLVAIDYVSGEFDWAEFSNSSRSTCVLRCRRLMRVSARSIPRFAPVSCSLRVMTESGSTVLVAACPPSGPNGGPAGTHTNPVSLRSSARGYLGWVAVGASDPRSQPCVLSSSAGLVTSLSVERADPIKALIRSAPSRLDAIDPAQTDGAVARPLPTADSGVMGHQVADPGSDRCDKGDRDDDLDQR